MQKNLSKKSKNHMFLPRKIRFWGKKVEFTDFFTQTFRYTRGFVFGASLPNCTKRPLTWGNLYFCGDLDIWVLPGSTILPYAGDVPDQPRKSDHL